MSKESNLPVGVVLLHPDAKLPRYSTEGAAGCDLYSVSEDTVVYPDEIVGMKYSDPLDVFSQLVECAFNDETVVKLVVKKNPVVINTGVAVHLNVSEELELRGRSGLGFNYDIIPFNGTIDEDYTGEIKVKLYNLGNEPFTIEKGMRFAQGVIKKVLHKEFSEVDKDAKVTKRGENGFAHTGLKDV